MIQPWLEEAQTVGIAAIHLAGGEVREVMKGAGPPEADPAEIRLALRVAEWLAARFGQVPARLRVDTLLTAQGPVLIEVDVLDPGPPGTPIPD